MEKKLPRVYANKIEKPVGNNHKVYYSAKTDSREETKSIPGENVLQKINAIFNARNYVYKADVIITLKNRQIRKRIVGKSSTHLITLENELIPISDILDIEYDKKM